MLKCLPTDWMTSMTLIDALREMDPKEYIFLGSATKFFEIAPVSVLADPDYLKMLDGDLIDREEQQKKIAERAIANKLTKPKRKRALKKRVIDIDNYIREFIPLEERQVREIYPRLSGDGTIVLIDGRELGSYWYLSEIEGE